MAASGPHACDTLPAARLVNPHDELDQDPQVTTMVFETAHLNDVDAFGASPRSDHSSEQDAELPIQQRPPRKLCVRHQRMADEDMNIKLQQVISFLIDLYSQTKNVLPDSLWMH